MRETDRETVRSEYDKQMEVRENSKTLARDAVRSSYEPESPNDESHGLVGNAATCEPVASLIDVPMSSVPTLPESEPYSHNSGIRFDPTPKPGTFTSELAELGVIEGVPFVPPTEAQARNMQKRILGKTHLLRSKDQSMDVDRNVGAKKLKATAKPKPRAKSVPATFG